MTHFNSLWYGESYTRISCRTKRQMARLNSRVFSAYLKIGHDLDSRESKRARSLYVFLPADSSLFQGKNIAVLPAGKPPMLEFLQLSKSFVSCMWVCRHCIL